MDLEPLKHSIAERTVAKNTLALIQEIALEQLSPFLFAISSAKSAVVLNTLIRHSACGRENEDDNNNGNFI